MGTPQHCPNQPQSTRNAEGLVRATVSECSSADQPLDSDVAARLHAAPTDQTYEMESSVDSQPDCQGTSRKVLAFIHVPKTGGLTVHELLRESFGAAYVRTSFNRRRGGTDFLTPAEVQRDLVPLVAQARAFSGHLLRPPIQLLDRETLYATLVRDPFSWAVSHYLHSLRRKWVPPATTFRAYMRDHYGMPNLQTFHFAESGLAADAIPVLEQFTAVGATDMLFQFLNLLRIKLRSEMGVSFRARYARVNAAPHRSMTVADLTAPEISAIIETLGEDLKLYHYARHRFTKDWRACPRRIRLATRGRLLMPVESPRWEQVRAAFGCLRAPMGKTRSP